MQNLAALYATFFAVGGSDAAGRGAQEARAPLPQRMLWGTHRVGILTFFSAKFNKKTFYHICEMKWPKSEDKIEMEGGGSEVRGPSG